MSEIAKEKENPLLKLALEMGPLLLFFLANNKPALFAPLLRPFFNETMLTGPQAGIFTATAVFMVALLVSLVASRILVGHLPIMPIVSAVVVTVFGGLTLYLQDDLFIKLKPTIVNALFGAVLLGGLFFGKSLLSYVLDSVMAIDDEGWRKLTLRWGLFFLFLAALNEVVWRTQSTDFWVNFKVFGTIPITMIFAMLQTPMIMRHQIKTD